MTRIVWIALILFGNFLYGQEMSQETIQEHQEHKFAGKHFFASYLGCDKRAMADLDGMIQAMDRAVAASGATVLDKTPYVFPPNGLTIVYLLSESHASLHTYPEYGACFVDLFTCGDTCAPEPFDAILRDYLKPQEVSAKVFHRHAGVEEVPYLPQGQPQR